MSITLTVSPTTVTLNPDLYWSDEHNWHPVEQNVERSITGALIVQSAAKLNGSGRPITLAPIDDASAWMTRATLLQLRNWAAVPGQVMTLTLRGESHQVIFRHHDGAAIEAEPIVHFDSVTNDDFYKVTLRLMVVDQ